MAKYLTWKVTTIIVSQVVLLYPCSFEGMLINSYHAKITKSQDLNFNGPMIKKTYYCISLPFHTDF